jgi:flagellar protein FlgJ
MDAVSQAGIYTDFSGLAELKAKAGRDAQGSLDQVAKQFESLFLHQMLKSMRQASLGEGILDSDQSLFYRDMFDHQLSLHLAEKGGLGLAEVLKRQLSTKSTAESGESKGLEAYRLRPVQRPVSNTSGNRVTEGAAAQAMPADSSGDPRSWSKGDFVQKLWPWAMEAAKRLGLEPQALIAQAALETGWGQHLMRKTDGSPSNNLFGIKADKRWGGDRVSVDTLEFEQGVAVKKREHFRSYDSLRESFDDYVNFLQSSPLYREALSVTSDTGRYFTALQEAGYATDPEYARKIEGVLGGRAMAAGLAQLKNGADLPL